MEALKTQLYKKLVFRGPFNYFCLQVQFHLNMLNLIFQKNV